MENTNFKKAYQSLNPEQKLAVDTIEGPVMVVAGPGTGKTQILTLRIANILLQTQVNPENILALTFTELAALEMRDRLVGMIGTTGYRVEINTFHGFCNEIIKGYPEDFDELRSAESITEVEQIQLIEKLITTLPLNLLKPFGDPLYYIRSLLSEINNLKKEGVSVDDLKKAIIKQEEEFQTIDDLYHDKGKYKGEVKGKYQDLQKDINKNKELCLVYENYQKEIREQKLYDFNDMLLEVKIALEKNKGLLLRLQEKFQYILVDEHQDTNAAQNKIIQLLGDFFDQPNIFVVGDEKQAIFRFQGASLENFLYFRSLYPDSKLISLVENYRSHQKILDAADSLIAKNYFNNLILPEKISLKAFQKYKEEPIKIARFNDFYAEYEFIGEEIKKKVEEGVSLYEIAVIGRNNKDLQLTADTFERLGIPYTISSDANILNDIQIQKIIFILRAVENVGSELDLLKAMHVNVFGIPQLDIFKIVQLARENNLKVYDQLEELDVEKAKEIKLQKFEKIKEFLAKLKSWQTKNKNERLENLFIDCLEESGLKNDLLSNERKYEILDKLITLFEEIKLFTTRKNSYSLADFLNYLDLCEKHNIALKGHVQTVQKQAVSLLTAHRSKGLEFEYVYIINMFDGHWGNARKRQGGFNVPWHILGIKLNVESEENEDERRLFYVALTRAKKDIILTYSTKSMEGKEQISSQFISEINFELTEDIDIQDFETQFLQKKEVIITPRVINNLSAKQKEYLQSVFLKRGLSITAVDNYLDCPWTYFYRNLLLFPGVRSNQEIYGSVMHHCLDRFIKDSWHKQVTIEDLKNWFNQEIAVYHLPLLEVEGMKEKAQKSFKALLADKLNEWSGKVYSEMAIRGIKLTDKVFLNGRLDMIEPKDGLSKVIVHDFKTGKPKSRNAISGLTASSNGNYLRQLTFYKLLLDKYKNGSMQMVAGVIDFVEPDEKGNLRSETFEIGDQEVKVLEDEVKMIAGQIYNLEFWDKFCDKKDCEYCDLRRLNF